MSTKFLRPAVKSSLSQSSRPFALTKSLKPPALVDVYRRKYPNVTPVVKNVADAPFGLQRETLLRVIGQQGIEGKFVFPLQKIVFNYCDMGGSSSGMREFILNHLPQFARSNPQFEIVVQPRPFHHPLLRGYYNNGYYKYASMRNFSVNQIKEFVQHYRNTSGMGPIKPKAPVFSGSESVRGVWSPFKDPQLRPHFKPKAPPHLYSNDFQ